MTSNCTKLFSIFSFLTLVFLSSTQVLSQEGRLDSTFKADQYNVFGDGSLFSGPVYQTLVLPDSSIIVAGDLYKYNGVLVEDVVKLRPDGSLDTSFHLNVVLNMGLVLEHYPGNRILVGGNYNLFLIDYNGQNDNSFSTLPVFGYFTDVTVQPDNKVIAVGDFYYNTGYNYIDIVRFNPDGSVDATFDDGLSTSNSSDIIRAVEIQPNGKILIGGDFNFYGGNITGNFARLNSNGSFDGSFNIGSGFNNPVHTILIDSFSEIVVGGNLVSYNGTPCSSIVKMDTNGIMNNLFICPYSCNPNEGVKKIIELSNKKLLIGGGGSYGGVSTTATVIVDSLGNLVNAFQSFQVSDVAMQSDGKVISVGGFWYSYEDVYRGGIRRFNPNGTEDSTFSFVFGAPGEIYDMVVLPGNNMVIVGDFLHYDHVYVNHIARVLANGNIDTTFNTGAGPDGNIEAIGLQSDGKLIIGGDFTHFDGVQVNGIARLNQNGSLDLSFNTGSGFYMPYIQVRKIQQLSDAKLLLCGSFFTYNGVSVTEIIRLNPDGTLDQTFNPTNNTYSAVRDFEIQTNGKIVMVCNAINGVIDNNPVKRLNANGTLDLSFNLNTSLGFISDIALQADFKIVGVGLNNVKRLNYDGSLDPTFITGSGVNEEAMGVLVLNNGQILVCGDFDMYNNTTPCGDLIRLNPNGTADSNFDLFQWPVADWINTIKVLPNGKIMAAGIFNRYLDKAVIGLARINNSVLGNSDLNLAFKVSQPVNCLTASEVIMKPIYGVPPFQFTWQTTPLVNNDTLHPNQPGFYEGTVTDQTNLSVAKTVFVSGPSGVNVDLSTAVFPSEFRPGFNGTITVLNSNLECTPVDAQFKFILPSQLTFNFASISPNQIVGDTLFWDYTQLTYQGSIVPLLIHFTTSTITQFGDSVHVKAFISSDSVENNYANNSINKKFPVVNGYDPNYLIQYPAGKCIEKFVPINEPLTYVAHFQNTGNSHAVNIVLVDSLDPDLDINTFNLIGSSHSVWIEKVSATLLKFHFDSIMLTDSTSSFEMSQGYVIFSLNHLTSSIVGTEILNKIGIYFDFNPVIQTNTERATLFSGNFDLLCNSNLNLIEQNFEFIGYPNPTSGQFQILSDENINKIELFDLSGKKIDINVDFEKMCLDLSSLSSGIYDVQISCENLITHLKVFKE